MQVGCFQVTVSSGASDMTLRTIFETVFFCSFQICVTCLDLITMAGCAKICVDIASSKIEL